MNKYTMNQFRADVRFVNATRSSGPPLLEMKIPADSYIELIQDKYSTVVRYPSIAPTFNKAMVDGIWVTPVYRDGSTIPSWDDVLEEYGRMYAASNPISHFGGYMQLDIGPWRYAVPLPRTSSFATMSTTPTIPPLDRTNAVAAVSSSPSPQMLTQEPPCLCSSRSLVTVGHEQGCRWLLWKSSGGAK